MGINKLLNLYSGATSLIWNMAQNVSDYRYKKTQPLQPKHDDLYIVEFPKSGITWLSFIISNIIVLENNLKININFMNITDFVPDIHVSRNISSTPFRKPGYRIIKSHDKFNPMYKKIIYLWRDPVEVMKSYYRMMVGRRHFSGTFLEFVKTDRYGVHRWIEHVQSWLYYSRISQRMYFMDYAKLKLDTATEIVKMLDSIGWAVDEDIVQKSVSLSSMKNMKGIESKWIQGDLRQFKNLIVESDHKFVGNSDKIPEDGLEQALEIIKQKSGCIKQILIKN